MKKEKPALTYVQKPTRTNQLPFPYSTKLVPSPKAPPECDGAVNNNTPGILVMPNQTTL